jgi:hypothetical protein
MHLKLFSILENKQTIEGKKSDGKNHYIFTLCFILFWAK